MTVFPFGRLIFILFCLLQPTEADNIFSVLGTMLYGFLLCESTPYFIQFCNIVRYMVVPSDRSTFQMILVGS